MKEKWYNKIWFMWLTLIIFSPVGIFLMWKNKKFTNKTRKILTGVFSIWFIIALATGNSDNSSTTTTKIETKTEATATPKATNEEDTDEKVAEEKKAINEKAANLAKFNLKEAVVARVVDGDTVELSDGSKVRFIGVNTPESTTKTEPYGKEASDYTKNQLTGKTVYLEKDVSETDKYGRLLRYVWLDIPSEINDSEIRAKMYNANLVVNGYAEVSTYPPDVKYQEYFTKYNGEARNSNKGLWAINSNGTTKGDSNSTSSSNSNNSSSTSNQSGSTNPNSSNGSTTQAPAPTTTQTPQNNNNSRIVYYVPNGKSYHYNRNCPTLSRSKTILEGSLQDVINKGKSDPCDKCVH